jgi:hypothetical protein
MNKEEKKRLKRLGAAEVERQSQELRELARQANPARPGSDDWAKDYSVGVLRSAPSMRRHRIGSQPNRWRVTSSFCRCP